MYVYFFCFNSDASIRMMILTSVIRTFCLDDFIIDIMHNKSMHILDNMQYKKCIFYAFIINQMHVIVYISHVNWESIT